MKLLLAAFIVTFAIAVTASVFAIWAGVTDAPWEDEPAKPATGHFTLETNESPVWLDHVQAWATVGGVGVALIALGGIYFSVRGAREEQRIEWRPYVRVDVAPSNGRTEDFIAPRAYHASTKDVRDLAPDQGGDRKVSFSAWVRNYQTNPLGIALHVSITAVIEYEVPSEEAVEPEPSLLRRLVRWVLRRNLLDLPAQYNTVTIPYCEVYKPVSVELFKIPRDWQATVWISSTTFYDLFDEKHEHIYKAKGTNAEHGRLACTYIEGTFESRPEARPRGPDVNFGDTTPQSGRA